MFINLGLKSLARSLTAIWFGSNGTRRTVKRNKLQVGMEALESRVLLTNFLVTTAADDSSGNSGLSLRSAIADANANSGADTITFDSSLSGQRFQLTQGQLTITDPLTITGLGATNTVIDAQLNSRVFALTQTAGDVTFDQLTVTAGKTTSGDLRGAGVYSYSGGTFTLTNSTITANATFGPASQGGGIFSFTGPIVLISSTVSGNSTTGANAPGGGIATNTAPITLINSTVSGNFTQGSNSSGGGIGTYSGNIKLINTTVAFNSTSGTTAGGGGLFSGGTGANGQHSSITLNNSIIGDDTAAHSTAADFFQGANVTGLFVNSSLIGNNTGSTLTGAPLGSPDSSGNLIGTSGTPIDPLLGALAINGGMTKTHALLSGSPAVDAGDNSLAVDQNGVALTLDQNGDARILHGIVDMGSFEGVNAAAGATVSFSTSSQNTSEGAGAIALAVNLSAATSQQVTIPFTVSGTATNGTDYTISSSPIVIPANSTSGSIQISIIDDTIVESNETIVVTLGTPTNASLGSPTTETVTIIDNDSGGGGSGGPTAITLSSNTVAENQPNAVIGTLSATDSNSGATPAFSIQSGGQGSQFVLVGNQLKVGNTGLDYESLSGGVASVTIRDTDTTGAFLDKTFSINVSDVNEAPTITSGQAFSVPSGSAVGTAVGTVIATDPDTTAPNKTLTYSIVSGNTNNAFSINSSTGQITVASQSAVNSSVTPQFTLQVKAADGGSPSLSATQSVTIAVGAAGTGTGTNTAPSIQSGQVFSTVENRSDGAVLGTVIATDPDSTAPNDTLTYSITGGNTNNAFAINSATGQLTVNNSSALDFETTSQYVLQIKVADGGSPSLSATGSVTVNITDVNEPPTIPSGQILGVAANAPAGTVVGTVTATDPDTTAPNDTLTYSIIGGNTENAFAINSATGQITVSNSTALNPANNPQFALSVRVDDGGSPSFSASQTVTIDVAAGNQAPTIASGQVFSINENSSANTLVGKVIATDPDTTAPDNTLTYSITGGNNGGAFAINSATGQITVNNSAVLNFEAAPQFTLQIHVADGGTPSLAATQNVTININDVNEAPSIPAGQNLTVAQNAPVNTVVGTVVAIDPDTTSPNNTVTYSIVSGDTSNAFAINGTTGQITVTNSIALDPANNPQFNLVIKAADGGSPSLSTTQTVTVTVSAVNRAPTIAAGQSFTIQDDATTNSVVGTVVATDPDTTAPNNTLTYSIVGGNTSNAFAINGTNGVITVNDASVLNSTTTPQYSLQIKVADGGSPSLSTTQTVTIHVNAPNHPPSIPANQNFTVTENSPANTSVGTVIATDPDTTAPNDTLTYSIISGNTNNAFAINPNTGLITVNNPSAVNFEANPTFTLTVRVVDGGTPVQGATQTVTISVTDINETPVVPANQILSVNENAPNNTVVGTVQATDPDLNPPDNTLTYSILSGDTNNAFAINPSTGVVTVNNSAALTFANGSFYVLAVKVADGGSPSLSETQNVRINLNDVNQVPTIAAGQTFTTPENPNQNAIIGTVSASDPDATAPNNTLTYSIIGGDFNNAFAIDPVTGQITASNPSAVNFETNPQFSLLVQVADGGNPQLSASQTVTINVTNVNEAPVVPAGQTFSVPEQSAVNTIVGTIAASDPDSTAPDNILSYSITGGNTNNAFAIDPSSGQITVANSSALNPATTPQFSLQVKVADAGTPSLSTTQTITINTIDVNQAPSIPAGQIFSVTENSASNTVVGTVIATDPDATAPNKTLTYSITGGDTDNAFSINPTTGQIIVNSAAALNFETTPQFTLQVRATDGGSPSLFATSSVTVNVINVDEAPVLPSGQSFSIAENSAANTVVGSITATDPDTTAPNNSITYSIASGNTGNAFSINSTTGQISVANSAALNFENLPVFTLLVKATDGGGLSDQQAVTINITDVNEPPVFGANQTFSIPEHSLVNTVVGTASATDPDRTAPNNTVTYSITGGNTNNAFTINSQTGQISVENSVALSIATNPTFTLQVSATDGGSPALSSSETVTINLTDVNEAPVIPAGQVFTLSENPASGQSVGTVVATDPDPTAPNNTLTYSIVAGNTGNAFAINSATGQLTVLSPAVINFETNPHFTLLIKATDGGSPALSAIQAITVNVNDLDEAPVIASGQSFTIAEHSAASTSVGTVVATDPDTTAPNNTLTYAIIGGNVNQGFAINSTTGQITVNNSAALDFATTPTFTLTITASDGGGMSTSQNVTVNLTRLNQAPVLTNPGSTPVYNHHGTDAVAVLPNITVNDPDSTTDLAEVIISISTPNVKKNPDTLKISSLSALGTVSDTTSSGQRQITVTLHTGVTTAQVQAALRNITFSTKAAGLKLTNRNIQVQVVDRHGASSNVITESVAVNRRAPRARKA